MAWRAVVRVLRSTLEGITSVVIPSDCRVCDAPLSTFTRVPVCPPCWNNLPSQSTSLCSRCGEDLSVSDYGQNARRGILCRQCRLSSPPFELAVAHGVYQGAMRSLLHLLKYEGLEPIAAKLGGLIADRIGRFRVCPPECWWFPCLCSRGGGGSAGLTRRSCWRGRPSELCAGFGRTGRASSLRGCLRGNARLRVKRG